MATYTISNSNGMSGGVWSRKYDSRKAAKAAIAEAFGWDEAVLSPSWAHSTDGSDTLTCWSAYATQEDCDADETGAHAPCITRHDDEGIEVQS
jgi:hypothetical protein